MVKYEIFHKGVKAKRGVVLLNLASLRNGEVIVIAVDENGWCRDGGNLFEIMKGGKVVGLTNVNPKLGFQLDGEGRIKIVDGGMNDDS